MSRKGRNLARQGTGPPRDRGDTSELRAVAVRREEWHSGPLPHPDILIRYNDAAPDAADRIIAMAERQSSHRQQLERTVVHHDILRSYAGLAAGFTVCIAFVLASVYLVVNGHGVEGTILGTVDIGALVYLFITGRNMQAEERQKKVAADRG